MIGVSTHAASFVAVIYPNFLCICTIKLVHVGLRGTFSKLVSIMWCVITNHLFREACEKEMAAFSAIKWRVYMRVAF